MADLTRTELQRLARLGAKARLEELRQEEAAIRRAFPDVAAPASRGRRRRARAAAEPAAATGTRKRRRMSAAARKAVSDRMRKYWADHKASREIKHGVSPDSPAS